MPTTLRSAVPELPYRPPPDHGLRVVHRDAALLVVDKPAGLLAVPGRGEARHDCLASRVRTDYPEARVVHRLDMATSGLLVFARDGESQRRLGQAFAERRVHKGYVAIVAGRIPAAGLIELPLAADWPNRPRQKVDLAGRPALTRYAALDHDPATDRTRVVLFPETGRTHQLRVHLAAIGHPILGDALYGADEIVSGNGRLLLHAEWLSFVHPYSGETIALDSPPPF